MGSPVSPSSSRPAKHAQTAPTTKRLPFGHRPALDGLRAVAALLVVLFHSDVPFLEHGYAGVDVFFVLSGFLITSLLVREMIADRRVDILNFYARRARRLLPVALLVLIVTAVVFRMVVTPFEVAESRGGFIASALYVANWYFLAQSQDYFAQDDAPSPVLHYWSLAVEEQFYFAWPILLLVLVLLLSRLRVPIRYVVLTLCLGGVVYAGVLAIEQPMQSYFGTLARAYQLLLGAAVALWVLRWQQQGAPALGRLHRLGASGLFGFVGLVTILVAASPLLGDAGPYTRGAISCLGAAALVLAMEASDTGPVGRFLRQPVMRQLGGYSYSMYLWHWPVVVIGTTMGVVPTAWVPRAIVVLSVTIALSAVTWAVIEKPLSRISLSSPRRRRIGAACGPIGALLTAVALLAILPVSQSTAALITATSAVNDPARDATSVATTGSADPEAPTVLLIGDSHGRFWVNGAAQMAADQGWRLVSVRRNGCAWPYVDRVDAAIDGVREYCDEFRTKALEVAAAEQPEVTLLVTRALFGGTAAVVAEDGEQVTVADAEWNTEVREGTEEFLDELEPNTDKIVMFEPIPETETEMAACLSTDAAVQTCSQPRVDPRGATLAEQIWREVGKARGIVTLNLDELVCPDKVCPAMVGETVTHQDITHLTDAYAESLMPEVERMLAEAGIDLSALAPSAT